ncbi:hypothetical protein O0L34_g17324 [Tuta absoluta]|nr:hypothetical protein O0L34_g17324 [Tuta absoluta]
MARWSALIQHGQPIWLLLLYLLHTTCATPGPCEVETGQSSIIVDIEESRGSQVNQSTIPPILPIVGNPGDDVLLSTVFPKGPTLFELDGKRLQLVQPLDRDADNLSHMVFQLVCQVKATKKRRTIPVIVRVSDINDNAPVFQNTPYETSVSELVPTGTTIFDGIRAVDIDAGVNGLSEYFIVPGDNKTLEAENAVDGYMYFSIPLPHQGQVAVNRSLDYERTQKYLVTIVASDRARDTKRRLSSTTTLTVHVKDDDDQDPSFIYKGCTLHEGACFHPEYSSYVNSGVLAGILSIEPEKIQAVDMDTLDARIKYSIDSGEPDTWSEYFDIDPVSGAVRQLKPVDTSIAKKFELTIRAEEITEAKRFTTAKLTITVRPVDASPPVVEASSEEGMVEENSPKGTPVLDDDGDPIQLMVSDPDLGPDDPVPKYIFELTTNYFDINKDGYLIVANENLDRDPPNPGKFRFQVVVREANGGAASAPLSLAVKLIDQNDNAPVIPKTQPINVPATLEAAPVYKVEATDIDEGENARITYSIYHVSNNGGNKFTIDPNTGVISSTGRLQAGEQYSLTVRATDAKGLSSQGIVELNVAPGPNTRPPVFSSRDYFAPVSEGAAINSTVTTVTAKDPENEPVTYSIVSGNDLRQFAVGSTTGIITVIRSLDREVLTRYQLAMTCVSSRLVPPPASLLSSGAWTEKCLRDINCVSLIEKDSENEPVTYSIVSGNDLRQFAVGSTTGIITVIRSLDREVLTRYQLAMTCVSSRLVPPPASLLSSGAWTEKCLQDINCVSLIEKDSENEPVTYSIVSGNDLRQFAVGSTTGIITVIRSLDREVLTRYQLAMTCVSSRLVPPPASLLSSGAWTEKCLRDINCVSLIEKDSENEPVTYSIVSGNDLRQFAVGSTTGIITVIRSLDREVLTRYQLVSSHYSVSLIEKDSENEPVTYSIVSGNDLRQFAVGSTTGIITVIRSLDREVLTRYQLCKSDWKRDSENEPVTYSIVSGNDLRQFAVGSTTGIITVIRSLDREVLTRYQLMVRAEDPGRLSSTATVNIKVTDINDNNPKFDEDSYQFRVNEGASGEFVGYVHATDADEGVNAMVSYSIPPQLPFSIDNTSGLISTNRALDYETTKEYAFVVTATDGAIDKRFGTASVTVQVQDIPDEAPVFPQPLYSVHVPENVPNYPVAKVHAEDPDTVAEITYTILMGDMELFSIDRKTGMIRTLKALDREMSARHEIVVGTEENSEDRDGATTTVEVLVDDKNDNAPIFTSVVRPVTVDDSSSIGFLVQTVTAVDSDATAPNNRVRYKLVGRGKASKYFHVEPDTGAVRIRDDLRKETDSEYTVDVQAYDQGEPVMSSVSSLTVYVSHSATVAPDVGLGFADTVYTEHVAENSPNGTLVRILPLLNKREHSPNTPLKCKLTDSSQKGVFYVKLTDDRDCAIYLNTSSLDYETLSEYSLEVQLESIQGLINPDSSKAVIKVHVTDANDNAPMFVFPEQSTIAGAKGKYYAIVTKDMLLGTNVVQVKAKDKDSGDYGKLEYQKNSWTKAAEEYFSLDTDTGVISNIKTFENVPQDVLPFKFSVTARDNPNSPQDYNIARASVVINVLQKDNQLIMEVADLNPDAMRRRSRSLLSAIEEKTGFVAGLEKLTTRHYLGENGTLESDSKGTDVWLYLIDPGTGAILMRDSLPVKKAMESGVRKAVAARLQSPVSEVRAPLTPIEPARRPAIAAAPLATALPAALLALAALVLVAASAATIYICASWNRYKKHKEQAVQQYGTLSMSMPPPRPASGYESSEDEPAPRYETQVLNMAVDDADLQLDFSSNNHAFNIHSVQYLSKENIDRSPTLSETATTARASSVNDNGTLNNSQIFDQIANNATLARNTQTLNRRVHNNHALNNAIGTLPRVNNNGVGGIATTLGRKINGGNNHKKKSTQPIMAYDDIPGLQRASDNDNVTFGKRNFSGYYDQSPVETTTEL